jgi:hypothetical protein
MSRALRSLGNRLSRRIGRAGGAAFVLLLLALLITFTLPQLNHRADTLRTTLAERADALARPAPPLRRAVNTGEQLHEHVAGFPPLAQNASDLGVVFDTARRRGLGLLKGEYQFKAEPNAPLVSYTATFPITHEYGALKQFTADVLTALPHVSMDELRMSRADAAITTLDSVVRFTFVYRRTP